MFTDAAAGALIAFAIATFTTPVGVSGAVFLVPVQVSVLKVASPAVTPTNLIYNLIAIPGALFQFRRKGSLRTRLAQLLIVGTLPGVVAGAVLRVELLAGPQSFYLVIAAVLIPLGTWLATREPPSQAPRDGGRERVIVCLSLFVGVVGGIYGIGGGSILAPILVGFGYGLVDVAPAALLATFLTSIVGVVTYGILSLNVSDDIAPDWVVGASLGLGGLAGGTIGALLQPKLSERRLRHALGFIAFTLGLRYAVLGLT